MVSDAEMFLEKLNDMFGKEDAVHKVEPLVEDGWPIFVFFFEDLPEEGSLTAVTYGLSEAEHPDWTEGRPELMVTLDTMDKSWGMAAGFFASQYQGIRPFSYSELYTLDRPISTESEMIGYFVFAPSFIEQSKAKIELASKTIFLTGLYPIYKEEIELYQRIGREEFWEAEEFDLYDVRRPNMGLKHAS